MPQMWLTKKQAAEYLSLSVATLERYMASGEIPVSRRLKHPRFSREARKKADQGTSFEFERLTI